MIKFIVSAIWICGVTIGAVMYSFQATSAKPEPEQLKPMLGGLDYVSTDILSVPLIRDGSITGYFLTKLVYTVDPLIMGKLTVPANSMILDEVYTYLYSSPDIDFSVVSTLDLNRFRSGIRDAINKRVDDKLIHDVMVEQVDYLSKNEIRDNALRRKSVEMKTPKFGSKEPAPKPAH